MRREKTGNSPDGMRSRIWTHFDRRDVPRTAASGVKATTVSGPLCRPFDGEGQRMIAHPAIAGAVSSNLTSCDTS